jgi:hypothetical protein
MVTHPTSLTMYPIRSPNNPMKASSGNVNVRNLRMRHKRTGFCPPGAVRQLGLVALPAHSRGPPVQRTPPQNPNSGAKNAYQRPALAR